MRTEQKTLICRIRRIYESLRLREVKTSQKECLPIRQHVVNQFVAGLSLQFLGTETSHDEEYKDHLNTAAREACGDTRIYLIFLAKINTHYSPIYYELIMEKNNPTTTRTLLFGTFGRHKFEEHTHDLTTVFECVDRVTLVSSTIRIQCSNLGGRLEENSCYKICGLRYMLLCSIIID